MLVLVSLFLLSWTLLVKGDPLVVSTANGKVRGVMLESVSHKRVDAWIGIPYAKPPIGELRFRHPVPADPWEGIKNTTTPPNSCVQVKDTSFPGFEGAEMWNINTPASEDCLYISVHAPNPRPKGAAVLVWIYGGGFYSGTSTLTVYDPRILVAEENIIFVAMQYRVANLGFLYMDSVDAPGNAGLYDQLLALEWVKDNIKEFGGDPERITIFGESAGASSVSFHLLSPLSRNLFSQGVMQSSSALVPWALMTKEESVKRGLQLAEIVGCPNDIDRVRDVLECLRKVNATELVNQEWFTNSGSILEFPFHPIVDGHLIPKSPRESLDSNDFKDTNILIGANKDEANFFLFYFLPDLFVNSEDVQVERSDFINSIAKMNTNINKVGLESIVFEYTNWLNPNDSKSNREAIDRMIGDFQFTCPTLDFAQAYSRAGKNVYAYYFSERSSVNPWPTWSGALHGDEISFIFGDPLNKSRGYDESEIALSKRMMKYWSNFAKTGDPNTSPDRDSDSHHWPRYTPLMREVLELNAEYSQTIEGFKVRKCAFWNVYLPKILSLTNKESMNPGLDVQ